VPNSADLYPHVVTAIGWFCFLLASVGIAYTLAAGLCVRLFFRRQVGLPAAYPAVSLLKPLYGDEIGLQANLEALCRLNYPGEIELVFGVQDPADPAIARVMQLQLDFPAVKILLTIDNREHGANRKISNVINIMRHATHDVIVLSDSDIGIDADYLTNMVRELGEPGVGLVTCLYRGHAHPGWWSRLSAMAIDYNFLPSVIFGLKIGLATPCFGSTIALHRSVLQRIGGFEAFADHLADDNAIGEAVRALGLKVAIPPMLVTHGCAESRFDELMAHEIRWSRTIRAVAGAGFGGAIITHPLPFGLLALLILGPTLPAVSIFAGVLASRFFLQYQVNTVFGYRKSGRWWLLPLRDMLSFMVFCATFFVGKVTWRGRHFLVGSDGMLSPIEER
jgi:ceramide glucosyltransferase